MKKVICAVILLFVFLLPFPQSAFAAEMDELLQEELQRLEVEAVDRAAEGVCRGCGGGIGAGTGLRETASGYLNRGV